MYVNATTQIKVTRILLPQPGPRDNLSDYAPGFDPQHGWFDGPQGGLDPQNQTPYSLDRVSPQDDDEIDNRFGGITVNVTRGCRRTDLRVAPVETHGSPAG
jgi:hypothetical protein